MKGPLLLQCLVPAMCVGRWISISALPLPGTGLCVAGCLALGVHGLFRSPSVTGARKGAVALGLALGGLAGWVEAFSASTWEQRPSTGWSCADFEVMEVWPKRGRDHRAVAVAEGWGRVMLEGANAMLPGQVVEAQTRCHRPNACRYDFGFDERQYLKGKGILYKCDVLRLEKVSPSSSYAGKLRGRIHELREIMMARYMSMPEGDARALVIALVSGDRTFMSPRLRRSFSDLGLGHLTAVSGFHTGMVAGVLLLFLRWLGVSHRRIPWFLIPLLWLFVGLCGFPPSALRALGMAVIASWGLSMGRRPHGMTVLVFVGLSMWAVSPFVVINLGVSLSFLATAGILLLNASIQRLKLKGQWAKRLCMALAVPLVATAFTAPVAWPTFGQIPVLFLPANLMATPWVTVLSGMTAIWWILPAPWAQHWGGLLLGAAELLVRWVGEMSDGQVFLLPLGIVSLKLAGAGFAIGTFLALQQRGMLMYWVAGVLTAYALLRSQHFVEREPRRFPMTEGMVSFDGDAWVVFPNDPREDIKWETRSLLERVSHDPPEYARWCGTELSFSRHELRYRRKDRDWTWISSSRTRCGSRDLRKPPKPPCP